jgi:hypothetical protein
MRDFVANGNSIVVTGGTMSQIFLNRNFLTQVCCNVASVPLFDGIFSIS